MIALGTLILLLTTNFVAGAWLRENTPNEGYRRIRTKWRMLAEMQAPVDMLVLGDSSGAQGVDPQVLSEIVGGSAHNLCTVADMTVVAPVLMLERYIERFGAPKRVVLVHVYDVWDRKITGYALSQTPLSPLEIREEAPWVTIDSKTRNEWLAGQQAPLFAESKSIAQVMRHAVFGGKRTEHGRGPREDGFSVAENAKPDQVAKDAAEHIRLARGRDFEMSQGNREALRRLVTLADLHEFDLYVVNGPLSQRAWHDEKFRAFYAKVVAGVLGELGSSPRVRYFFQEPRTYPDSLMTNVDHLTYEGARIFTEDLAKEIQRELVTPE